MKKLKTFFKVSVACMLMLSISFNSYATETNGNSSTTEVDVNDKGDIEAKRDEAQNILDALEADKKDLELYVTALDTELSGIQADITDLIEQQAQLQEDIEIKQAELEKAKSDESSQYDAMKRRIKYIYENGDINYVEVVFKAADMSDIVNSSEYISKLADYDYMMLQKLIKIKADIETAEEALQLDLDQVDTLLAEQEEKEGTMQTLIDAKTDEIALYQGSIEEQASMVAQYEKELDVIEQKLAAMSAQNNGSGTTYTGGALLWPCPASSRITSYFGPRQAPVPGASTYHRGIDIGVGQGNNVIAAASGTVVVSAYSNSAGEYIMINHGGGLSTVYMHNSVRLVSVGDTVTAGQVIAYSGSTGYSSGAHLHFGVAVNGSYVDPLVYLK